VYHFGIIDFLQDWTFRKKVERFFKIYVTRKDPDGLSVMPPLPYKERFQSKILQIFDSSVVSNESRSSKNIIENIKIEKEEIVVQNPLHLVEEFVEV
jgi:hypothetical protein